MSSISARLGSGAEALHGGGLRQSRKRSTLSPTSEKAPQRSDRSMNEYDSLRRSPSSEKIPSDIDYVDDEELRHSARPTRRRSSSIPMAPPSLGTQEDEYDDNDDDNDEYGSPRVIKPENILGGWHFAPLLIAVIPPLGALMGGRADAWSDAILLVLASFWLYQFLKVPHDIYHAARTRRILHSDSMDQEGEVSPLSSPLSESAPSSQPPTYSEDSARRRHREAAAAELRRSETMSLVALVLSPLAGAWLLSWLMDTFTDGNRFLNTFNIRLFMLASGIKPWSHAFSLLRKRMLHLQEVVHYPSSRVEHMNRRLSRLETEILTLRKLVAMKTDVTMLKDGIDVPLTQLSRTMRRYEKKEEHLRMSAEDKFDLVESRLEDLLREVAINAELIEEERRERERAANLPASIFHAVKYALGQRSHESSRHYLHDTPRSLPSSASLGITAAQESSNGAPKAARQGAAAPAPPRYYTNAGAVSTSPSRSQSKASYPTPPQSPGAQYSWHEEGLYYWVFLPLNLPKAALRFANGKVRGAVTDGGYDNGYQAAIRHAHESQQQRSQQRLSMATATSSPSSSLSPTKAGLRGAAPRSTASANAPAGTVPQVRSPVQ